MPAPRLPLLPYLSSLALALGLGVAGAACQIERLDLGVPAYDALSAQRGSLRVTVHCDQPTEAYRLALDPMGVRPNYGSQLFDLQLTGPGGTLKAQLLNALPGLAGTQGGTLFRGTQTLDFPIFVPQDQWQAVGGAYRTQLGLNLIPAEPGE